MLLAFHRVLKRLLASMSRKCLRGGKSGGLRRRCRLLCDRFARLSDRFGRWEMCDLSRSWRSREAGRQNEPRLRR